MSAVAPLAGHSHRIGRYEPIRRLAVGGMAEIYLARLPGVGIEGFEKLVVLKRILPQHALDPEGRQPPDCPQHPAQAQGPDNR